MGFLVVVVGEDAEGADFGSVLHMGADAGAEVVVADAHQAERLAGVVREPPQVHLGRHLSPLHELVADIQMAAYHLVHAALNLLHLLLRGTGVEDIVALALFSLDMRIARPRTAEHPPHGVIQNMVRGMHRRIVIRIVGVEERFFPAKDCRFSRCKVTKKKRTGKIFSL